MTKNAKYSILELNNIDIYGKHFNGFSLQKYFNSHPEFNFSINLIVNNKLGSDSHVFNLFPANNFKIFDYDIEEIERKMGIKNQISISEEALIRHPLYKKADILHFHMYHNMHLPVEFLLRIPAKKKIIIDIHDTFWLTDKNIPMLEVFQYADKLNKTSLDAQRIRILNSIDATFIIHSPYMQRMVKKSDATKNLDIRFIDFGIDNNIFHPLEDISILRKKYKIAGSEIVLLCRSQKEFKGIDYIEAALKQLRYPGKITLLTVGVKNLIHLPPERYRIIELGIIDSEKKLNEIFNICDVFLAPSTEESFGFMAIEAMSCGKPVIVFDGTALPDTVNAPNIGILVPRDAAKLAEAIKKLISKPNEIKRRGQLGRQYILKKHTEQKYFSSYAKLFDELSRKTNRHIIKQSNDAPPKNILLFKTALKTHIPNSEIFDYNNTEIQKILKMHNTKLYNHLNKTAPRISSAIKRTIPTQLKNKLKKIKERLHL